MAATDHQEDRAMSDKLARPTKKARKGNQDEAKAMAAVFRGVQESLGGLGRMHKELAARLLGPSTAITIALWHCQEAWDALAGFDIEDQGDGYSGHPNSLLEEVLRILVLAVRCDVCRAKHRDADAAYRHCVAALVGQHAPVAIG